MKKLILLLFLFIGCIPLKKNKYPTVHFINKNHVLISDSSIVYDMKLSN